MSTLTLPDTDVLPELSDGDDPSRFAHILHPRYTPAMLTSARVEGTPVEAMCGHRWVPSRDARKLPLCQRCKALHEAFDGRPLEYT